MVRAELQDFSTYPCTLSAWMRRCVDCDLRLHDPVPLNQPAHPLQDISIDPSSVRRWPGCIKILLFFNKNDPCIVTLVKLSILRYRTYCTWISVFFSPHHYDWATIFGFCVFVLKNRIRSTRYPGSFKESNVPCSVCDPAFGQEFIRYSKWFFLDTWMIRRRTHHSNPICRSLFERLGIVFSSMHLSTFQTTLHHNIEEQLQTGH